MHVQWLNGCPFLCVSEFRDFCNHTLLNELMREDGDNTAEN